MKKIKTALLPVLCIIAITAQVPYMAYAKQSDVSLPEKLKAPEGYTAEISSPSGGLTVHADMSIEVPDVQAMPVVKAEPRTFTQSDLDRLIKTFVGDETVYSSSVIADEWTKSEIKENLAFCQREIDSGYYDGKEKEKKQALKDIEDLKKVLQTAPEKRSLIRLDKKFIKKEGNIEFFGAMTDGRNGQYQLIRAVNWPEKNIHSIFYSSDKDGYELANGSKNVTNSWDDRSLQRWGPVDVKTEPLIISKKEAIEQAEAVLKSLGIQDMVCDFTDEVTVSHYPFDRDNGRHIELDPQSDGIYSKEYQLEFVRKVNGIPLSYTQPSIRLLQLEGLDNSGQTFRELLKNHYSTLPNLWPYERVSFLIGNDGIIQFLWDSPYEIKESTSNAQLLSFNDIAGVFKTMMIAANDNGAGDTNRTIDIKKARLGLMRVTDKKDKSKGTIIPVWDFFGPAESARGLYGPLQSYLTINAMDGTVIDRSAGY